MKKINRHKIQIKILCKNYKIINKKLRLSFHGLSCDFSRWKIRRRNGGKTANTGKV